MIEEERGRISGSENRVFFFGEKIGKYKNLTGFNENMEKIRGEK